jgi:hypothetical protein
MDTPRVDRAEEEIRRGERARVFLDDGIFTEAWKELEDRLHDGWRQSPTADTAARENIFQILRAMDSLRGVLEAYVQNGKIARDVLEQIARERIITGQ